MVQGESRIRVLTLDAASLIFIWIHRKAVGRLVPVVTPLPQRGYPSCRQAKETLIWVSIANCIRQSLRKLPIYFLT